jgi:hypothetical protein
VNTGLGTAQFAGPIDECPGPVKQQRCRRSQIIHRLNQAGHKPHLRHQNAAEPLGRGSCHRLSAVSIARATACMAPYNTFAAKAQTPAQGHHASNIRSGALRDEFCGTIRSLRAGRAPDHCEWGPGQTTHLMHHPFNALVQRT